MTSMSTPFSLRLALAEGLSDRGDHLGAANSYAELVAEAEHEDERTRHTDDPNEPGRRRYALLAKPG